jgi:hypothetical protein
MNLERGQPVRFRICKTWDTHQATGAVFVIVQRPIPG